MRIITLIACAALLSACGPPTDKEKVVPPPTTEVTTWDARLIELMPYIDACISKAPDSRWVSYAGPTGEALITVRLSGPNGGIDCTIPDDDPNPTYAETFPRRENIAIAGEHAAIFVRGPGENPGGECYEAPEVRAPDGTLLGWMADPEGC